ncbi:hypothetical protein K1719_017049 [Acacia pycnantha]|nr:hypothetical protein K1719_017049 [Acacia pycnantha]
MQSAKCCTLCFPPNALTIIISPPQHFKSKSTSLFNGYLLLDHSLIPLFFTELSKLRHTSAESSIFAAFAFSESGAL